MASHELHQERIQVEPLQERAILVACHLPSSRYDARDPLGELRDLSRTAGAEVVGELIQKRVKPDNATYLGKGKIEELKALKEGVDGTLIIFDNDLSPSQIRNIEKVVECRIIDRSELILDIFAGRATTGAAKLQVELAQLEYTYPRLRAMWSHFGQIAGGAPVGIGTRGPGETQIETDRRLVQRRKTILRRRLEAIRRRRVREVSQRTSDHFTVCLVGYTNAGKSTLFNALTGRFGGGGAYADDRLFATLTTRTRRWPLVVEAGSGIGNGGDAAMLSDTVGFVRDLPHHLVASFRATLEEAIHADVLLIVVDVSDPLAHFHYEVVGETLDGLEAERKGANAAGGGGACDDDGPGNGGDVIEERVDDEEEHGGFRRMGIVRGDSRAASSAVNGERVRSSTRRILVLNKVDLLEDQSELAVWHSHNRDAIPVSAIDGTGLNVLRERVAFLFRGGVEEYEVEMPFSEAKALSYAEHRGEVIERRYDERNVILRVRLGRIHADYLRSVGGVTVRVR